MLSVFMIVGRHVGTVHELNAETVPESNTRTFSDAPYHLTTYIKCRGTGKNENESTRSESWDIG